MGEIALSGNPIDDNPGELPMAAPLVLVVDDDQANVRVLVEAIELAGFVQTGIGER